MADWEWKIGALQGYGEAAWQERDGRLRRITVIIPAPTGQVVLARPVTLGLLESGPETEFEAQRLVILGNPPRRELIADLDRAWGGGKILPANGPMLRNLRPPQ